MAVDPNIFRSAGWTPERARENLALIEKDPETRSAFLNKNHPAHRSVMEKRGWLHQVLAGEPAPPGSSPSPWPKENSAAKRIADIQKDPAFRNKMDPRHEAVVYAHGLAVAEQVAGEKGGS